MQVAQWLADRVKRVRTFLNRTESALVIVRQPFAVRYMPSTIHR
jgi:hypothetical protein